MAFNGARLYPVKYVMQDVRLGFSWKLANAEKLSIFTGMVHWVREVAQFDLPARVVDSRGAAVVSGRDPWWCWFLLPPLLSRHRLESALPPPASMWRRVPWAGSKGTWNSSWNHGVQWWKGQGSVGVEGGPRCTTAVQTSFWCPKGGEFYFGLILINYFCLISLIHLWTRRPTVT